MDTATEARQQPPPLAQQPRRVHTITDRFSMANTYLVNDERIIVVDPGSALNVRLILEYLQHFLHRLVTDIDLIVLTHLHPDHTGGVEFLRQACQAPIAASIMAQRLVESWKDGDGGYQEGSGRIINQVLSHSPLPGSLHHLDLFAPHYQSQVQMVDLWLEDVAGLPHHLHSRPFSPPPPPPHTPLPPNP